MKIAVLNGSPKGKYSVTLQTANYLAACDKDTVFQFFNIGQEIKKLQQAEYFTKVVEEILSADAVLFCYPVYTFLVPYQLHRFIEQLKNSSFVKSFEGKFAFQISTSKHFYDTTAMKFIEENCFDLKMKVLPSLTADMDDLLTEKGRMQAKSFYNGIKFDIQNNIFSSKDIEKTYIRSYNRVENKLNASLIDMQKSDKFDTVILTDNTSLSGSLYEMIMEFQEVYPYKTRLVNIDEFKFAGGCLGCFTCASDGKCVYKDGFEDFLRGTVQRANAFVYAFTLRDHSMGSSFKLFDDRQFCNGHRPMTIGAPIGYLVSGNYSTESNVQTVIEGRAAVGQNYFAGIACDNSLSPTESIHNMSARLAFALENNLIPTTNFLGVGGNKIFRDLIYVMGGLMRADYRFYKTHGLFDFPQKQRATRFKMKLVGSMMANAKLRQRMKGNMNKYIIMPYEKVINAIDCE